MIAFFFKIDVDIEIIKVFFCIVLGNVTSFSMPFF